MKVLVLQLARLGDILLSSPSLRALKRNQPDCELHLIVRKKFAEAARVLDDVDQVHIFDTEKYFSPLFEEPLNLSESLKELKAFTQSLPGPWDEIINLSFSPASSHLLPLLRSENTIVRGYSRHSDNYFAIPDDASAYFHAQVGVGKYNRVHLVDLFSMVAGVDLPIGYPNDSTFYNDTASAKIGSHIPGPYIVVHVGASTPDKRYDERRWASAIRGILAKWVGRVVLIGDKSETELGLQIQQIVDHPSLTNMVGTTSFSDLFSLIGHAKLFLGCDSSPLHISSLWGVKALNISCDAVNFWETGPLTEGSLVLHSGSTYDIPSDLVSHQALAMLGLEEFLPGAFQSRKLGLERFYKADLERSWPWEMIRSMYFGSDLTCIEDDQLRRALENLREINTLALQELKVLKRDPKSPIANSIFNQIDALMSAVVAWEPRTAPVFDWKTTECIRIAPMSFHEVLDQTWLVHERLKNWLNYALALPKAEENHEESTNGKTNLVVG